MQLHLAFKLQSEDDEEMVNHISLSSSYSAGEDGPVTVLASYAPRAKC